MELMEEITFTNGKASEELCHNAAVVSIWKAAKGARLVGRAISLLVIIF